MTLAPEETPAAVAGAKRDALGNVCFYLHLAILFSVVFGWLLPVRGGLEFYLCFVPAMAAQWMVNKNSCILNNLETLIRTGRWRKPGNAEEGAWLLTLARNMLGIEATPARMDAFIYAVLVVLWGLGLVHLLRL